MVYSNAWRRPLFRISKGARQADYPYFKQIAQAADQLGYTGVLLPTGRSCEDPWLTAAALAAETTHLKFLVALRPGLMQPSVAARMTSTLDRLSGGRLLINVVAGEVKRSLKGMGCSFLMMNAMRQQKNF